MFVIEDRGSAIALMLASLLFLGTWPAVLTLLERRGRLPQRTYLDYSLTNLLAAVLIALTFGQLEDSKHGMPNFFTQLGQDNWPSVLFAMAGGVVLSVGNLSTQYAWAYVGLSVTEVISSSMVVVIGMLVISMASLSKIWSVPQWGSSFSNLHRHHRYLLLARVAGAGPEALAPSHVLTVYTMD
ncbi:ureide permease 2-like [Miscanthus floridulus]|uniref:ureide permease 2-like n=1 Tax=Miscanthus floridulus TaxID=154761 RepID=UPI0034578D34